MALSFRALLALLISSCLARFARTYRSDIKAPIDSPDVQPLEKNISSPLPFSVALGLKALMESAKTMRGDALITSSVSPFLRKVTPILQQFNNTDFQRAVDADGAHPFGLIWKLFHKVSAIAANTDVKVSAAEVLAFVYVSVRGGLECEPCRAHFLDAFEAGAYGVGSVLQAPNERKKKKRIVMWLWRVHNAVTLFRAVQKLPASHDLRWPSYEACNECWKSAPDGSIPGHLIDGGTDRDQRGNLHPSCFTSVVSALNAKAAEGGWGEREGNLGPIGAEQETGTSSMQDYLMQSPKDGRFDKFSKQVDTMQSPDYMQPDLPFGKSYLRDDSITTPFATPKSAVKWFHEPSWKPVEPSNDDVDAVLSVYDTDQVYEYLIRTYA